MPDSPTNREVVIAELGTVGFESFAESDLNIEAFIPSVNFLPELLVGLFDPYLSIFSLEYTTDTIPDQNWNEVWEENYFTPLVIADRCVIRSPSHLDYPKMEYEIVIHPNMAFGTGNHETTSMIVEFLLQEDLSGKRILDMGCGTGILGIMAMKRGGSFLTAIDIDEWAVESARANFALNQIEDFELILGDAKRLPNSTYDLILANIHKNILIADMSTYSQEMKSGGRIVLSGFLYEDLGAITQQASDCGLMYQKHWERDGWIASLYVKK